jgi:hypothetical protein
MISEFRASAPNTVSDALLGPLVDLPGTWVGKGFNLISLPDKEGGRQFRIQMNATLDQLTFSPIGAPFPDRGSVQDDIEFSGVHYLQRVTDAGTDMALHLEPGLWLNVPATTDPLSPPTVVRQGTVPHGDSFLAQGTSEVLKGPPTFLPASSTPTKFLPPPLLPGYFGDPPPPMPPGIPPEAFGNPNQVLMNAIANQKIVNTVQLTVSTSPVGGIINIPFIVQNANATQMDAIFCIETVENPDGSQFMQLQYTQTVTLYFLDINWPHIAVATLVKQ